MKAKRGCGEDAARASAPGYRTRTYRAAAPAPRGGFAQRAVRRRGPGPRCASSGPAGGGRGEAGAERDGLPAPGPSGRHRRREALRPCAASSRAAARPKGAGRCSREWPDWAPTSYCSRVPGRGSRDLDSPPEVSRSLHPSLYSPHRLRPRSPPRAHHPVAPSTPAPGPTSRARRWVPSLRGFVCGPSRRATGLSASPGRPLSLHGATPRSSLPAPPPAESLSPSP